MTDRLALMRLWNTSAFLLVQRFRGDSMSFRTFLAATLVAVTTIFALAVTAPAALAWYPSGFTTTYKGCQNVTDLVPGAVVPLARTGDQPFNHESRFGVPSIVYEDASHRTTESVQRRAATVRVKSRQCVGTDMAVTYQYQTYECRTQSYFLNKVEDRVRPVLIPNNPALSEWRPERVTANSACAA